MSSLLAFLESHLIWEHLVTLLQESTYLHIAERTARNKMEKHTKDVQEG